MYIVDKFQSIIFCSAISCTTWHQLNTTFFSRENLLRLSSSMHVLQTIQILKYGFSIAKASWPTIILPPSFFLSQVIFFADRDINPGEEITYDYHFNHEDEGKKIPCYCRSKNCRRFLNWQHSKELAALFEIWYLVSAPKPLRKQVQVLYSRVLVIIYV